MLLRRDSEQLGVSSFEKKLRENGSLIRILRSWYLERARSTRKADRERLERAIRKIYVGFGIEEPVPFIWCDSFLQLISTADVLSVLYHTYPPNKLNEMTSQALMGLSSRPDRAWDVAWRLRQQLDSATETVAGSNRVLDAAVDRFSTGQDTGFSSSEAALASREESIESLSAIIPEDHLADIRKAFLSNSHHYRYTRRLNGRLNSSLSCPVDLFRLQVCQALGLETKDFSAYIETVEGGGWWYPMDKACLACDGPSEIYVNDRFLLHNELSQAFSFEDGFKLWALNGVSVPPHVVTRQFTPSCIESEKNLEIRRIMIERFGYMDYLKAAGIEFLQSDMFGALYIRRFKDDEPIVVVKVRNSTPEPDGSYKQYFLRVPPGVSTARQAVAWTFGMTGVDYLPAVET